MCRKSGLSEDCIRVNGNPYIFGESAERWHAFVHIAGKILRAKDRGEADGIKIDHFTGVTGCLEPFGEMYQNGMAKGFGVGVENEANAVRTFIRPFLESPGMPAAAHNPR
jgi:hypothetical protein